jgi:phosphoglycolate phosphatase-like HAD superfamily hydrolase
VGVRSGVGGDADLADADHIIDSVADLEALLA